MTDLKGHFRAEGITITIVGIHPGPVLTQFPASAKSDNRFQIEQHPFKRTQADLEEWEELMHKNGQPVSQTVEAVLHVIKTDEPDFWNPAHPDVAIAFDRTYKDVTGTHLLMVPDLNQKI